MSNLLQLVGRHGETHADANGIAATDIPGLMTVRAIAPGGLDHAISRPLVCLVMQGGKRVAMGTKDYAFGAGDSLLITADVPTVSQITRASLAEPYLSLVIELDPGIISDLAQNTGLGVAENADAVQVDPTGEDVADTALRLMRLLERPAAMPVLGSSLLRELHYWLLAGRHGAAIRRLGVVDGHVHRIGRAVVLLRADFAKPLRVKRLAEAAGMSPSSFHQHFRQVTSFTPLQFQKRLRLIEARRLMMGGGMSAGEAAYAVGYESASQFTREYGRTFGLPPAQDVERARAQLDAAA